MNLSLVKHPDPRLSVPCAPIEKIDHDLVNLIMRADIFLRGLWGRPVGLAAPQIGDQRRWFIALGNLYINPELVWVPKAGWIYCKEGCYSLEDNAYYDVMRPYGLKLRWQDLYGRTHEKRFNGLEAEILHHELRHLDGVCLVDESKHL